MKKLNELAMQIVRENMKNARHQLAKTPYWKTAEFAYASYSLTTLIEILEYLRRSPDISPIIILEEYRDQMDDYACRNIIGSYMFSVAYDTVTNIIDELISSKEVCK